LYLAGVWSQASVLCWCIWQQSGFSRSEEIFTFNLLERKTHYKQTVFSKQFAKIMLQYTVLY
jgi:hypothetical protein